MRIQDFFKLVAVSGCSNVLGSINDIGGIGRLAHTYGARILVDGAQLAAHRRVDVDSACIDYFVFSGHKMYAPFGSGGLIVRKSLLDFHESMVHEIERSGNANVVGIAAMGKAMKLLDSIGFDVVAEWEEALKSRLLEGLGNIPDVRVFGHHGSAPDKGLGTGPVVSFRMRETHHNLVTKQLAEKGGITVRNGCLCAHLLVKHLMKMSMAQRLLSNLSMIMFPEFTKKFLPGIVRMSFGIGNIREDVDRVIEQLAGVAGQRQPLINRIFARMNYASPVLPVTAEQKRIDAFVSDVVERVYQFSDNSRKCNVPGRE